MYENYEAIARSRVQPLNLYEPTFEYKADLYPSYDDPIIISTERWTARFDLMYAI